MNRSIYHPKSNPYAHWTKLDSEAISYHGNTYERITYESIHGFFWRPWQAISALLCTVSTIGIALFFPSIRKRWNNVRKGKEIAVVNIMHSEDDLEARTSFYQDIAINKKEPWAQHNFGYCLLNGIGIDKDETEALKWIEEAAEQGNPPAQNNLGCCLLYGTGTEKDEIHAVKYFQKAIDNGNVNALINLGNCYKDGTGVTTDKTVSTILFEKAQSEGVESSYSDLSAP